MENTTDQNDEVPANNLDHDTSPTVNEDGIEQLLGLNDERFKKHVFILSSAGKPVYSRHGSEDKLVTLFGVMQALVSVVQDGDDSLHAINCEKTIIVFLTRGPIILVSVSQSGDSIEFLKNQLLYVYNQVVSVLTLTQVTRIFEERHNYDLRRLLTGSERLIDHLLTFTETQPEFMLDSISSLYMSSSARDTVASTIISCCSKIKNLVFAIMVGNSKVITMVRMKKYNLKPCDVHLICNLVSSSESFKTAESWTPICLPNFNPGGFLYAHVSYLSDGSPACLLLFTVERDTFYPLSDARQTINRRLVDNQCMVVINEALSRPPIPMSSIGVPFVRHFLYKCLVSSQVFVPALPELYNSPEKRLDLLHKYEVLHSSIHSKASALKLLYQQLPNEVMLAWVCSQEFEIYVTYEPLVSKPICIEALNKLIQWIQKEEDKLFFKNCPTF